MGGSASFFFMEKQTKFIGVDYSYVEYPMGSSVKGFITFATNAAETLMQLYPNRSICLVGRGTSGAMMAGAIAHTLIAEEVEVHICMSRKEGENSHSHSLSGISRFLLNGDALIIVDDFVCEGLTMEAIIDDIHHEVEPNLIHFDAACITNPYGKVEEMEQIENKKIREVLSNFDYVIACNPEI